MTVYSGHACVRACVHACVRACVRACMYFDNACVWCFSLSLSLSLCRSPVHGLIER